MLPHSLFVIKCNTHLFLTDNFMSPGCLFRFSKIGHLLYFWHKTVNPVKAKKIIIKNKMETTVAGINSLLKKKIIVIGITTFLSNGRKLKVNFSLLWLKTRSFSFRCPFMARKRLCLASYVDVLGQTRSKNQRQLFYPNRNSLRLSKVRSQ